MSKASFTIAYDGPALRDGAMDVRDLAPALLAVGQLFDAANSVLNGDNARVNVQVTATGQGSFEIVFDLLQTLPQQLVGIFSGDTVTAALNLKEFVITGVAGVGSLVWLIKYLRGRKVERIEQLSANSVRLTIEGDSIEVSVTLLRLYQDIPVRSALQRVVDEPLKREGIDVFEIRENKRPVISVTQSEAAFFARPELADEVLVQATRRSAFSIISLAFKEDNKWRLFDGNTQISALIEDQSFLQRVDANQIAFAKGDILLCDVRVTQKRTAEGLRTEYVVEQVIEHRPAARQLPLLFDTIDPPKDG